MALHLQLGSVMLLRFHSPLAWVGFLITGCSGGTSTSPQPEPPEIYPGNLLLSESQISGMPNSITPAEGVVRVVSLDSSEEEQEAPVSDDGSFETISLGGGTGLVRLQTAIDGVRGKVMDFVPAAEGRAELYVPPLDCVFAFEEIVFDSNTSENQTLEVANYCAFDVTLVGGASQLRFGDRGFTLADSPAGVIPAGQLREWTVSVGPSATVDSIEVLKIETTAPTASSRFVTLRVE